MIKPISFLYFLLVGFCLVAQDQEGWNWPEDEADKSLAVEKQAYYKVQMKLDDYNGALRTLSVLYDVSPDLNESIYIDGAKVIDEILNGELPDERKARLEDSLLWTYDMRIKFFDNDASATDRKAYSAFKMYYRTPAKYALLRSLYQDLYVLESDAISDFNLTPYMMLANFYYKYKPDEIAAEEVLDIHQTITAVIDSKIASGARKIKLQKEQDKIDAFLSSMDILNCEYIEKNLVPKFKQDPTNLNMTKKIISYSLRAKCTDTEYFAQAGESLFKQEPNYALAKALGDKAYSKGDYEKALEFYGKALELAENADQKYDAYMGSAGTYIKTGRKSNARSMALEAINVKPGDSKAYNLIGNLYMTSFEECKAGESQVKDRAIFIAAYEMYQKAGNSQQMTAAQEQFPSIEDIFNGNFAEGDKVTVDCWINETVTLKRR